MGFVDVQGPVMLRIVQEIPLHKFEINSKPSLCDPSFQYMHYHNSCTVQCRSSTISSWSRTYKKYSPFQSTTLCSLQKRPTNQTKERSVEEGI